MKHLLSIFVACITFPLTALASDTPDFDLDHTVFPEGTTMTVEVKTSGRQFFEAHVYRGTDNFGLHIWDVYTEAGDRDGRSRVTKTFFRDDRGAVKSVVFDTEDGTTRSHDFEPHRCMRTRNACSYTYTSPQSALSGTADITPQKMVTSTNIVQAMDERLGNTLRRLLFVYQLDSCGMVTDVEMFENGLRKQAMHLVDYTLPGGERFGACKPLDLGAYAS